MQVHARAAHPRHVGVPLGDEAVAGLVEAAADVLQRRGAQQPVRKVHHVQEGRHHRVQRPEVVRQRLQNNSVLCVSGLHTWQAHSSTSSTFTQQATMRTAVQAAQQLTWAQRIRTSAEAAPMTGTEIGSTNCGKSTNCLVCGQEWQAGAMLGEDVHHGAAGGLLPLLELLGADALDELPSVDLDGALLLAHAVSRARRVALVVVDRLEVLQPAAARLKTLG